MCTVSSLGDQWSETFPYRYPHFYPSVPSPPSQSPHPFQMTQDAIYECAICGGKRSAAIHSLFEPDGDGNAVSREEFDALRKEMVELKELLKAAKRFDEATGRPDCEVDEKVELIKRVAEAVGVDLEDLFE